MERGVAAATGIAIIIGVLALGYGWYQDNAMSDQLSSVNATLSAQSAELHNLINGLQGTITSLQTSLTQNQQADSALAQQVNSLQDSMTQNQRADNASAKQIATIQTSLAQNQKADDASAQQITAIQISLQTIQTKLSSLSSQLNATKASNSASLQQISSQLQNISTTIQILSKKVNALYPQLPQSTLVIVASSYNNATNTFTFVIQNTGDTLIYAQMSVAFYSYDCGPNGLAGTYYSQMYTFKPSQNTTTTLDLHLGAYYTCTIRYINHLTVNYIAAPNIVLSPTYTFNVVPYYRI